MGYRDFFVLLIRIFAGYYFFQACLSLIHVLVIFVVDDDVMNINLKEGQIIFANLLGMVFLLFLIFKSSWVVNLLNLHKGFQEAKLDLGALNARDFALITCFFIGASLLIGGIIHFISTLFVYLEHGGIRFRSNDIYQLLLLISGALIIYKKNTIANLATKVKD